MAENILLVFNGQLNLHLAFKFSLALVELLQASNERTLLMLSFILLKPILNDSGSTRLEALLGFYSSYEHWIGFIILEMATEGPFII